jgi:predicted esterase
MGGTKRASARRFWAAAIALAILCLPAAALADKFTLQDGRILEGVSTRVNTMKPDPSGADTTKPIVVVDNNLSRTFFPFKSLKNIDPAPADQRLEEINIHQPVAESGLRIGGVGAVIRISPWDEPPAQPGLGHRTFKMAGGKAGTIEVLQGITKITPVWCRVEGLLVSKPLVTYIWDERIATSSIPPDKLSAILNHYIDRKNFDDRLKIVRLYLQGQRYRDAEEELKAVQREFPNRADGLKEVAHEIKQLGARQVIDEIDVRRAAGQHQLAQAHLSSFPPDGVDGEILQKIRAKVDDYAHLNDQGRTVVRELAELTAKLSDDSLRKKVEPLVKEISSELSINTLDRMATYRRFAGGENTPTENLLALAISGWLIGAGDASENLPEALSMAEVRNQIRDYLRQPNRPQRDAILAGILTHETVSPKLIAALAAHMTPHLETSPQEIPGFYGLSVAGLPDEADTKYWVQLPPEYDPHFSYPCILALHGIGMAPKQEIDWWAGELRKPKNSDNLERNGQAARRGYIVIAPEWTAPHQDDFEGSAREHDAILSALRDACRRFAIDTDRVFLTGFSAGGNAAWDLGLSHPDLWAGVIPIAATADKQVQMYWKNAEQLPLYFVCGELDGDKMRTNGTEFDRYMNASAQDTFDCTVVEYEGRGHEHFSDEILRLFDWMGRKQRKFFPKTINAVTNQSSDYYFWWLELRGFQPGGKSFTVNAKLTADNGVLINTGLKSTLWLAPEMIDFTRPITVIQQKQTLARGNSIRPDPSVLLEDVRTRGDRQHPFWAKVESRD